MTKVLFAALGLFGMALLAAAAAPGDSRPGPERTEKITVHFSRTRGVGDFDGFPDVNLDATALSAEESRQLRRLIADAHFFELTSSPTPPPHIPDPPAGYDLTVSVDGRTHAIWVTDGDVGPALRPLIDWLTQRARLKATAAVEQPVRVVFTKSGGIAGRHWTTTADSSALSAEDARKLRQLIADARFFDLPERFPPTEVRDGFGYSITVEMDGKRHTVDVSEEQVPARLQPLVDWLSARAVFRP
jgi:hypothetical protein